MSDRVAEEGLEGAEAGGAEANPLLRSLKERFGERILAIEAFRGDATAVLAPAALLEVATFLRDEARPAFDMLLDVTAVDFLGRRPRFEIVYHLVSTGDASRVRLKLPVEEETPSVPSLVPVWPGANWLERETFDMYGIRFDGHPDLRRIYLYDEFIGHPLRKDYPKQKRQPLIGPGSPGEAGGQGGGR